MDRLNCGLIELKFADAGTDTMTFTGYGAVFGNIDSYGDVIDPGAFAAFLSDVKSGKQAWPAMLSQHGAWGATAEDMTPIGVWTDFAEDGHGLKVTGTLADTPRGREMYTLMKMTPRPAIDGMSIGYIAKEAIPRSNPDEPRRRLKRIDLVEISMVTRPANGKARVTGVKALEELSSITEIEDYLRDAGGFSRKEAKTIIARVKNSTGDDAVQGLSQIAASLRSSTSILKGNKNV